MKFFCIILLCVFIVSCKTQQGTSYYYIPDVKDSTAKQVVKDFDPVIQKNDLLSIQVYSASLDPRVDQLYNLNTTGNGSSSSGSSGTLSGFLVDETGDIEYPRIGRIHVEGLTKKQVSEIIRQKFSKELNDPSVVIRFLNFRITMLGEVGHAGTITIPYEKVTILEAIGMAGDIPLTGKRNSIRIIREENGVREFGSIDLTSKSLFQSPYFYLKQNDIIIVDPTKVKIRSNEQTIVLQRITFALTFITTAALLYNLFKK
jgi:polysaccharide biosynthesis/export protein